MASSCLVSVKRERLLTLTDFFKHIGRKMFRFSKNANIAAFVSAPGMGKTTCSQIFQSIFRNRGANVVSKDCIEVSQMAALREIIGLQYSELAMTVNNKGKNHFPAKSGEVREFLLKQFMIEKEYVVKRGTKTECSSSIMVFNDRTALDAMIFPLFWTYVKYANLSSRTQKLGQKGGRLAVANGISLASLETFFSEVLTEGDLDIIFDTLVKGILIDINQPYERMLFPNLILYITRDARCHARGLLKRSALEVIGGINALTPELCIMQGDLFRMAYDSVFAGIMEESVLGERSREYFQTQSLHLQYDPEAGLPHLESIANLIGLEHKWLNEYNAFYFEHYELWPSVSHT